VLMFIEKITFDDAPPVQSVAIHTDALVVCRTSGNPPPEVSWRFKGRRIMDGKQKLSRNCLKLIHMICSINQDTKSLLLNIDVAGAFRIVLQLLSVGILQLMIIEVSPTSHVCLHKRSTF